MLEPQTSIFRDQNFRYPKPSASRAQTKPNDLEFPALLQTASKLDKVQSNTTDKMIRKKRNYFQRKKRTSLPIKKIFLLGGVIFFLYFLLFSSFFELKKFQFGEDAAVATSLLPKIETKLETYKGQHLTKINTSEIEKLLTEEFPEIFEPQVSKKYPSTIKIDFGKQPLKANIINETPNIKKTYIANNAGQAVKEDFESPNLPYITIISEEPLNPKKPLLEASQLDYILKSMEDFQTRFGMKITATRFKPIARELHLLTEKNFYIWLDIQQPYDIQFKKLKKSLPKLDIYNIPLEYIDLRIAGNAGDKIIYKPK